VDFVEICNVCTRKAIIKAAKRIFNSVKICRSYCDFCFGITFFGTQCMLEEVSDVLSRLPLCVSLETIGVSAAELTILMFLLY